MAYREAGFRPFLDTEDSSVKYIPGTHYVMEELERSPLPEGIEPDAAEIEPHPEKLDVFRGLSADTIFLVKFPGSSDWDGIARIAERDSSPEGIQRIVIWFRSFATGVLLTRGFYGGPNTPREIQVIQPDDLGEEILRELMGLEIYSPQDVFSPDH